MKKINKMFVTLMVTFIVILSTNQLAFAESRVVEANKVWTIKFNMEIDETSVTKDSIYVLQGTKKHSTRSKLTSNKNVIEVRPVDDYEAGKSYTLVISTKVESTTGKVLKEKKEVSFEVEDPNDKIQTISSSAPVNSISIVTVKTSSDVHRVKIGTNEMHYEGKDTYTYTLFNVKDGDNYTVYAYDENNKLLKSEKYKIGD